jgi:hypothetical protein
LVAERENDLFRDLTSITLCSIQAAYADFCGLRLFWFALSMSILQLDFNIYKIFINFCRYFADCWL